MPFMSSSFCESSIPLLLLATLLFMEYAYISNVLRAFILQRYSWSSSWKRSAEATISSIWSSERRPLSASMVILSRCPLLSAQTLRIPFTSISNVTEIFGVRAGAGEMPAISNTPSLWFSDVLARSPSNTWIRTSPWLSTAVENILSARVGIVVLRGIMTCMTPPAVCKPSDKGVTSSSTRSLMRSSSMTVSPVSLSGAKRAA
mmetsp:Transcript_13680/g.38746  ORF Transcript_13680/g.38746 Transcript_13680/m.38746 type:complete len:203 (-) Transcript_13680:1294-1902(-)